METQKQNLFLLEDNSTSSARIAAFLEKKYKDYLSITTFDNVNDLLKSINLDTVIVLLDDDLKGENGTIILQQIKKINANTEVIIFSSDDNVATAIDAYRKGAKSFVSKNKNTFFRIQTIISSIVYYPAIIIQRFFGLKELLSIFIVEILYIIIFVLVGYQILF